MPQPTERADRILDAAGELMIRLGYRKVTIEDVARQAGIGKGTVYLHWRTKEQLFESLILRAAMEMLTELAANLRRDPGEIQPHRFLRAAFIATQRNPLLRALVTADAELLGSLTKSPVRAREQDLSARYHALITKHGLVRDDVPHLTYAINAATLGFYTIGSLKPGVPHLDDETAADVLAHTVRHAFEPDDDPDPASLVSAANEIADLFDDLNTTYREWIYAAPGTERG
ncbi:TetR/AcrR family transcriptional regulator [Saccharopolyspora hirsuta]|uniref:TetR/AcrR family transcriptional regulator n=1 Tax=Saccharopolyspora hirsuta TaxID=1837 RepID=A0A5M7C6H2_SACHI|nr:TetR/AcrR family transcriptional regulator [Saccharopolyspora hirsuta]KAA5836027.1 TetR/AcrR family transcriptional regulator [Saccharopolyspora hirsuta]